MVNGFFLGGVAQGMSNYATQQQNQQKQTPPPQNAIPPVR